MTDQEKYQISIIMKHLEKADDTKSEEEARVHNMAARVLLDGLDAKYGTYLKSSIL